MNMKFYAVKALVAGITAGISAAFGWMGWLVLLYICSMALDYITGTILACKEHRWSSSVARKGLWTKLGSILSIVVSRLADLLLSIMIRNIPAVQIPVVWESLLCPVVLIWYTITELGSIMENAGRMGAPIPTFLKNYLSTFYRTVEKTIDQNHDKD